MCRNASLTRGTVHSARTHGHSTKDNRRIAGQVSRCNQMLSSGRPRRAGNRTKIAHDTQRAKSATSPLTSNPDFKNPEFLYAREPEDQRMLPRRFAPTVARAGKDGRTASKTYALLRITLGGRTSEAAEVRSDAGPAPAAARTDGPESYWSSRQQNPSIAG